MYFSKNSRYVLRRAQCISPTSYFLDYFKGSTKNLCVKPPNDDPSKPPLRLNIPEDSRWQESLSGAAGRESRKHFSEPRSKSLLAKTNKGSLTGNYENEYACNVPKSESEIQLPKIDPEMLQSGLNASESGYQLYAKADQQEANTNQSDHVAETGPRDVRYEPNEGANTNLDDKAVYLANSDKPEMQAESSSAQGNSPTSLGPNSGSDNNDSRAVYIIIDIPEKQSEATAQTSGTSDRNYLKMENLETMSKASSGEWTETNDQTTVNNVLKARSKSLPAYLSKPDGSHKVKFQVHEIEEPATYVFHVKIKKSLKGISSSVGVVPEKDFNTRNDGRSSEDGAVFAKSSTSISTGSYKGKDSTPPDDRRDYATVESFRNATRAHRSKKAVTDLVKRKSRSMKNLNVVWNGSQVPKMGVEKSSHGKNVALTRPNVDGPNMTLADGLTRHDADDRAQVFDEYAVMASVAASGNAIKAEAKEVDKKEKYFTYPSKKGRTSTEGMDHEPQVIAKPSKAAAESKSEPCDSKKETGKKAKKDDDCEPPKEEPPKETVECADGQQGNNDDGNHKKADEPPEKCEEPVQHEQEEQPCQQSCNSMTLLDQMKEEQRQEQMQEMQMEQLQKQLKHQYEHLQNCPQEDQEPQEPKTMIEKIKQSHDVHQQEQQIQKQYELLQYQQELHDKECPQECKKIKHDCTKKEVKKVKCENKKKDDCKTQKKSASQLQDQLKRQTQEAEEDCEEVEASKVECEEKEPVKKPEEDCEEEPKKPAKEECDEEPKVQASQKEPQKTAKVEEPCEKEEPKKASKRKPQEAEEDCEEEPKKASKRQPEEDCEEEPKKSKRQAKEPEEDCDEEPKKEVKPEEDCEKEEKKEPIPPCDRKSRQKALAEAQQQEKDKHQKKQTLQHQHSKQEAESGHSQDNLLLNTDTTVLRTPPKKKEAAPRHQKKKSRSHSPVVKRKPLDKPVKTGKRDPKHTTDMETPSSPPSNKSKSGDSKDSMEFHSAGNVVKISSEAPVYPVRFCAAYPPTLNDVMTSRSRGTGVRKRDPLLNPNLGKINFRKNEYETKIPQGEDADIDNCILFPREKSRPFDCDALFKTKSTCVLRDDVQKKSTMESGNTEGKSSVDTLSVMKKVKEIVNFDLNNAVKIFGEGVNGNEVSSVIVKKDRTWAVDTTELERCIAVQKTRMFMDSQLGYPFQGRDADVKPTVFDVNSSSPKYLPGRNDKDMLIKVKNRKGESVIVYNPYSNTYDINLEQLEEAVDASVENFEALHSKAVIPEADDPLQILAECLRDSVVSLELKGGDSILVFDELTQSWKVDYTILEKREEQIRHEEELTKRSELILETIEKIERSNISNIPMPNTREKKIFDYASEEWKTYKPNESEPKPTNKSKHPFKETKEDAEEIRKKNSDLYDNLFVVNKNDPKMNNKDGKEAPGRNTSGTKKEASSKGDLTSKDGGSTTNKSDEPPKEPNEPQQKPEVGEQICHLDVDYWGSYLRDTILPYDRPPPPKPTVPVPPPPKDPPTIKMPPAQPKTIEDPKMKTPLRDRKIEIPKIRPFKDFKIEFPKSKKDVKIDQPNSKNPLKDIKIENPKLKPPLIKEIKTEIPKPKTPTSSKKPPSEGKLPPASTPAKQDLPSTPDSQKKGPGMSAPAPPKEPLKPPSTTTTKVQEPGAKAPPAKPETSAQVIEPELKPPPLPIIPKPQEPPPKSPIIPKTQEPKMVPPPSPIPPKPVDTDPKMPGTQKTRPETPPPQPPSSQPSNPPAKESTGDGPASTPDKDPPRPQLIGSPTGDKMSASKKKDDDKTVDDPKPDDPSTGAGGKKGKKPSDHYISENIVEMSKNSAKDFNSKAITNKGETIKLNITTDKRNPSKITEINLNKKCQESESASTAVKKTSTTGKKSSKDSLKNIENRSFYRNFEKYKSPFSDPDYEEKPMKINSDTESNPNLKKLNNWNKTLVLHDVAKSSENVESWLKDETDKMATLLLKVLQEAAEGKPRKKPAGKGKVIDKATGKSNPYDTIRKKQENSPENFLIKVRSVNLALEAEKKMKFLDSVTDSKGKLDQSHIPVQSAKTMKSVKVVDAVRAHPAKESTARFSPARDSQNSSRVLFAASKPKLTELSLEAPTSAGELTHTKVGGDLTDDIPGPEILKRISNTWKLFPVLGCQMTIFTLLRIFQLVNVGSSVINSGSADKSRRHAFAKLFAKYGPIVNLQGPLSGNVILVHRPEHLSAVFDQDSMGSVRSVFDSLEQCRRDAEDKAALATSSTDWSKSEWNHLRKYAADPMFKDYENFFRPVDVAADSLVNIVLNNRNGQNFVSDDFMDEVKKWSLEGLCNVLFTKRMSFLEARNNTASWSLEPDKLFLAIKEATECMSKCERGFQIWRVMGTPSLTGLSQAYRTLSGILSKQLYQAEMNVKSKNEDLKTGNSLSVDFTLLESMILFDGMTTEEITCTLIDILLLGTNALSSALGFLLYNLAQNVKVQYKLFNEVKEVLPNKNSRLTCQRLDSLKYLQACIKESLRLNTPFPLHFRLLQNDILLSNYVVPKGTYVVMDSRVSCMRDQVFDEPERFMPERWLQDEMWKQSAHTFSAFPLCHGPRAELVKQIVEMQLCSCLAKIIRNFEIEYHFGEIMGTENFISFPDKPLKLNFVDRTG